MTHRLLSADDLDAAPWAACGQASLASLLGVSLDDVRNAFRDRTWTNLSDMIAALARIGSSRGATIKASVTTPELPRHGLALIQLVGSWSSLPVNHPAQLQRTHWIAISPRPEGVTSSALLMREGHEAYSDAWIFDVNAVHEDLPGTGGWMPATRWERIYPSMIAANYGRKRDGSPRATGEWWVRAGIEVSK